MIGRKAKKFVENKELYKAYNRDFKIVDSKPDGYCEDVVKRLFHYLSDDGFYDDHPEKNHSKCAFISPCRFSYVYGNPNSEDKALIDYFKCNNPYEYRFRVTYEIGGEEVFFIPDISLGEAMSVAATFEQNTFIYKDKNGCREICSKPFMDTNGNYYEISDIVHKYVMDNEWTMTLSDVARLLVHKTKTCEVEGWKHGNNYEPKDDFELYFIDKIRPLHPVSSGSKPWIQKKYLIYKENKNENR